MKRIGKAVRQGTRRSIRLILAQRNFWPKHCVLVEAGPNGWASKRESVAEVGCWREVGLGLLYSRQDVLVRSEQEAAPQIPGFPQRDSKSTRDCRGRLNDTVPEEEGRAA